MYSAYEFSVWVYRLHGLVSLPVGKRLEILTQLLFMSECQQASSESMDDIWLPTTFSSEKHFRARKALEHGLLRPMSSDLRSEVTSEVIWRRLWPQRPPKRLLQAIRR